MSELARLISSNWKLAYTCDEDVYIMAVLSSSNDSVMNEWNTCYFVTKTFMKFGSVIYSRSF